MRENCATPNAVPLPLATEFADSWEGSGDSMHRVIMGVNRGVTDSDVIVWTSCTQFASGRIDTDGEVELPALHVDGDLGSLNSDQGRELAAALLAGAAELDKWAER